LIESQREDLRGDIKKGMLCDRGTLKVHQGLLAVALCAGCSREVGAPANGAPADLPRPVAFEQPAGALTLASALAAPPVSAAASTAAATAQATNAAPERPFTLVELSPTQGDLAPLLHDHATRARDKKLRPFVEFYADWCKPCRDLDAMTGDARMIDALRSTYIIKLNVDDWEGKLRGTGFVPRQIPVFYAIDEEGRPTGRQILGFLRGTTTPEKLAPRLRGFFQG
jgi:thiol-disulfide isomerase/thioredoxin